MVSKIFIKEKKRKGKKQRTGRLLLGIESVNPRTWKIMIYKRLYFSIQKKKNYLKILIIISRNKIWFYRRSTVKITHCVYTTHSYSKGTSRYNGTIILIQVKVLKIRYKNYYIIYIIQKSWQKPTIRERRNNKLVLNYVYIG